MFELILEITLLLSGISCKVYRRLFKFINLLCNIALYSYKICVQEFSVEPGKSTRCAAVRGTTYYQEIMDSANFEKPKRNSDYGPEYFKYKLGGSYNLYIVRCFPNLDTVQ